MLQEPEVLKFSLDSDFRLILVSGYPVLFLQYCRTFMFPERFSAIL